MRTSLAGIAYGVVSVALLSACGGGTGSTSTSRDADATTSANASTDVPSPAFALKGSLRYLQRIALPPDSTVIVEVRDSTGGAEDGPVVAEQRIALDGRQVPIPFELTVPPGALQAGRSYSLRGGVLVGGRPAWATDAVPLPAAGGDADLGELMLEPFTFVAFGTTFRCGEETLQYGIVDDAPSLVVGSETFTLREVPAASGAKYEAVGDATTSFWNKGERALVSVRGRELPECVAAAKGTPARDFVARGNEPGWRVDIGERIRVNADYGQTQFEVATPAADAVPGGRRYTVAGATPFIVTVLDRPCADNMTGMPHPNTVEFVLGGRTLRGCGGEPASLLTGAEWTVTALDGAAVKDGAKGTLQFGDDGRVSGRAFCNQFNAAYALTGEGLSFSKAASTMMACEPEVSELERKFHATLGAVGSFEIASDGQLVLKAPGAGSITARR
jgi:heat shock protein HslJ/uncharacterized lipoprotein YbaY